jgi:trans-aconitate methyltransferase
MVGGLAFGLALGGALGLAAWAVGRRWRRPPFEAALIEATAWRYLDAGIATWEFVRGKLHRDPVYLALLASGELPRRGRLVDLGCGHGIALALLATAAEWPGGGGTGSRAGGAAAGAAGAPGGAAGGEAEPAATAGGAAGNADGAAGAPAAGPPAPDWPADWPPPPAGLELLGIERAPKRAAAARSALGGAAEVRQGDLAAAEIPACDAALLLDVLHYLGAADQAALLDRSARALVPGGVLLVREADAAGGLRFALTRAAERLAALARGRWRQRFHYRSAGEWARLLAARGLEVETRPMGRGTPFANVLLVGCKPPARGRTGTGREPSYPTTTRSPSKRRRL